MNNSTVQKNTKIIIYCAKCGARFSDGCGIRDSCGNIFCCKDCRREFHYENRREMDDRLNNHMGDE